jgi:16S rRNA (cytosine967-C5)-methyltransferase
LVVTNLSNARLVAYELLLRVSRDDSYINLLLPSFLQKSGVSNQDRGLVQELSYGALRWQLQYDAIVDSLATGKQIDVEVRIALRLGLHQLFRMRIPAHAAINESVELIKRIAPRASGFANAILRSADRIGHQALLDRLNKDLGEVGRLSIIHSHPEWIVRTLLDSVALDSRENLEGLLAANNETPKVNLAALSESARSHLLAQGAVPSDISPIGFTIEGNPEQHLSKDVRVQDFGSQLVALSLLELSDRGGNFLDMCSGPGGKSAVLLNGLESTGRLVCYEPSAHRAKLVSDAVGFDDRVKIVEGFGQDVPESTFDAVLLDAPCSGLGSLRRKPESRWRKQPTQLVQLETTQSELLDAGLAALRPGGVLLYSTCSPVISETNSKVVDALAQRDDVELVDLKPIVSAISPSLKLNEKRKTIQLWTDLHHTDAMFMAAFRRVG